MQMDNSSSLCLIKKGNTTTRSKYYRVRIDALHDSFEKGLIAPEYLNTSLLPADALTKALSGPLLKKHKEALQILRR